MNEEAIKLADNVNSIVRLEIEEIDKSFLPEFYCKAFNVGLEAALNSTQHAKPSPRSREL